MELEFKKGDRVRITMDEAEMSDFHEGETMQPEHHEYCNARMLGRECDCGLQELILQVKDLSFMVRRFVRAIRKVDPENKMADEAVEYLVRKKLHGCILRNE